MNTFEKIITDKINSILVYYLGQVGDTLVSIPALGNLRHSFPNSTITLITSPTGAEILKNCPYVNEIIPFQKGLKRLFPFLSWIRNKSFDLFIDLHFDPYRTTPFMLYRDSFIFGKLCGIPKTTFYPISSPLFCPIIDSQINPEQDRIHMAEYMLKIIEQLDIPIIPQRMQLWFSENEEIFTENFVKNRSIRDEDLVIAVQPGSKRWFHRWPLERYAEIIEYLSKRYNAKIFVIGNTDELELVNQLRLYTQVNFISLAGILNLRELASILSICDLLICNNSGPLHIAVALGIPTISFTGPSSSTLWGPYQDRQIHRILYQPYTCSPCEKDHCFMGSPFCLYQISAEYVKSQIDSVIQNMKKVLAVNNNVN